MDRTMPRLTVTAFRNNIAKQRQMALTEHITLRSKIPKRSICLLHGLLICKAHKGDQQIIRSDAQTGDTDL